MATWSRAATDLARLAASPVRNSNSLPMRVSCPRSVKASFVRSLRAPAPNRLASLENPALAIFACVPSSAFVRAAWPNMLASAVAIGTAESYTAFCPAPMAMLLLIRPRSFDLASDRASASWLSGESRLIMFSVRLSTVCSGETVHCDADAAVGVYPSIFGAPPG